MSTNETPKHVCPTPGERLVNLRDSMLAQFREGTPEQVAQLSATIHLLKKVVDSVYKQHDACFDLIKSGDMGADKKALTLAVDDKTPAKVERIRQERSDAPAKKKAVDFSALNF